MCHNLVHIDEYLITRLKADIVLMKKGYTVERKTHADHIKRILLKYNKWLGYAKYL